MPRRTTTPKSPLLSPSETEEKKYYCTCCGNGWRQQKTHFYMSRSPLFAANNKYITLCTNCLNTHYEQMLVTFNGDESKAVEYICHQYDWYFNIKAFNRVKSANPSSTNMLGEYLRRKSTYSEGTYGDFYTDTIKDKTINADSLLIDTYTSVEEPVSKASQAARKRWGESFDDDEIRELEVHYKMLHDCNPDISDNQEIFIKDLCTTKLLQIKALREVNTKNYKDMTDLYSAMFNKTGLRATPETDGSEKESYGVTLAVISQYTPEEYYKNKSLYKDEDHIGEYYDDHVLRPLKNLQFGTKDRDKKHFVPNVEIGSRVESGEFDGN